MDSDIFKICNVFNTCYTNAIEEFTNALQVSFLNYILNLMITQLK